MNPKEYTIGNFYHTTWSRNDKMRWVLVDFNIKTNRAILKVSKTGKTFSTELNSLYPVDTENPQSEQRILLEKFWKQIDDECDPVIEDVEIN